MANAEHLQKLREGAEAWNSWRHERRPKKNLLVPRVITRRDEPEDLPAAFGEADLQEADLAGMILIGFELSGADLRGADLSDAWLQDCSLSSALLDEANLTDARMTAAHLDKASLRGAKLREAFLSSAYLRKADLTGACVAHADLEHADLARASLAGANLEYTYMRGANLNHANLQGAKLVHTNLEGATLVETNLEQAILRNCEVYGCSAWSLKLTGAEQSNLIITRSGEPSITVDDLEIAQFLHLLLDNAKIRATIDTITSKVVLILGRFTPERKRILDAIRQELRNHGYLAVVFDFDKPATRDTTETISTLAHLARFVIADITDARSIPQELQAIVPNLPSVPVQPLLRAAQHEYGMFDHIRRYPSVLPAVVYRDQDSLMLELKEKVIDAAEAKATEQRAK